MKKTARGFNYLEFKDINNEECTIQKSSVATEDCLWLGLENNSTPHHVTGEVGSPRMHINKKLAKELIKHLTKFVKTGDI